MKIVRIIVLLSILASVLAFTAPASGQGPCEETYVVQQGDTLSGIAVLCETTVAAILEANPGLEDPSRLFVGQRLEIPPPEQEEQQPVVSLTPACGPAGSEVLVEGRAFPANAIIDIEVGEQTAPADEFVLVERLQANANGRFATVETIPNTAQPSDNWIMVAVARTGGPRFEAASNPFFVTSAAQRGATTTYIVQPGDTLRRIAARFDTTISALIAANPDITDPSLISVGQRLIIPVRAEGDPAVEISPSCGPAGSEVQVLISDFPDNARVEISLGVFQQQSIVVARDITGGQGEIETEVTIPDTAQRNQPWVVIVETVEAPRIRASSTIFTVTQSILARRGTTYIVQPGDMLIDIATRFGVSVQALLAANPEISNPNQLNVGQRLRIPGQEEQVTITPPVGPPGTTVRAEVANFPGNTRTEIGVGRSSTDFEVVETGITNPNGDLIVLVNIPAEARPNERWLVVARARPGRLLVQASSEFFTVLSEEPGQQQIVTIWPQQGRPGSTVFVVAAGFPRYTPVEVKAGPAGTELELIESTVSDINGTLSSQLAIPETAQFGQEWLVVVATTKTPSVEASSPRFVVTR